MKTRMRLIPTTRKISGKRGGSVLAATLLLGLSALGLSFLSLAAAQSMFMDFGYLSAAIERENIAREALEFSRGYFITHIAAGLAGGWDPSGLPQNMSPIDSIPSSEFAPLASANRGARIEGTVIDLNYADSFEKEAQVLEIPGGKPSVINTGGGESVFYARRYELRAEVTLDRAPDICYMMRQGILLLINAENDDFQVLTLYINK